MSEIQLPQHKIDKLLEICDAHGNQPGELINVLHKAQHLFGYLPAEVQRIVADKLNIPVSKVYGVVTFYSFFTMTPKVNIRFPYVWEPLVMSGELKKYWMNLNGY